MSFSGKGKEAMIEIRLNNEKGIILKTMRGRLEFVENQMPSLGGGLCVGGASHNNSVHRL